MFNHTTGLLQVLGYKLANFWCVSKRLRQTTTQRTECVIRVEIVDFCRFHTVNVLSQLCMHKLAVKIVDHLE